MSLSTLAGALDPFLVEPRVMPPLDPNFRPGWLAFREHDRVVAASGRGIPTFVGIEQPGRATFIHEIAIFPDGDPRVSASRAFCERLAKTMIWLIGGSRLWVDGPPTLVEMLRRHFAEDPTGQFDARLLGEAYRQPFEIVAARRAVFPSPREATGELGGHLNGNRIGFDLGASDRKAAAVVDGEVVFSEEIAWDPSRQTDPRWHFAQIDDSIRRAATHLPSVGAIGGSAAGIYVDNEVRVASLFRSVPGELFGARVRPIFRDLQRRWGGVPFEVVNDGEVTALAGALSAGVGSLLGMAMGSSQAAGYVTREGRLTSRLNELAFVPVDYAADAPTDEWSGDRGCGVQCFSQQAVGRLLSAAGIEAKAESPLPLRLVLLQELMAAGDERALRVYETIGTYLGYALLAYGEFYDLQHLLLLGRVTTGPGGDVIAARAADVLRTEDRAVADALTFHAASERDKRHGQAVAAASLAVVDRRPASETSTPDVGLQRHCSSRG